MGLIIRSSIVIGTIYAMSPAHDLPESQMARHGAPTMSAAARAAQTAEDLCGPGMTRCVIDVLQALQNARNEPPDRKLSKAAPGARAAPARPDEN
jgi:hypothetical protein